MPFKKSFASEEVSETTRYRNWIWTLNNYTEEEESAITEWEAKYLVFGREIGRKKGTPHLQGFVMWNSVKSFSQLKKLNPRISWRVAKTTVEAAEYCKKDGDFYESGTAPAGQGKRSDIDLAYDLAKAGKKLSDACEARLNYQALRVFQIASSVHEPPPVRELTVQWFWGPAGSGKTYEAIVKDGGRPLEYRGGFFSITTAEHVVIDDIDHTMPAQLLLKLLQEYTFQMPVKGSYMWSKYTKITVTCTMCPEAFWAVYPGAAGHVDQLLRRITTCRYFPPIDL